MTRGQANAETEMTAGSRAIEVGTLAVCVLCLMAGCGATGSGGPDRTTFGVPSATEEPSSTPDDSGGLPPGVNESGAVDTVALLSVHSERLENRSATVQSNIIRRYVGNGTVRYFSRTVGQFDGRGAYVFRQLSGTDVRAIPGEEGRIEAWSNGTAGVRAVFTDNETTYRSFAVPRDFDYDQYDTLSGLFSTLEPRLEERRSQGDTEVFVLRAERSNVTDVQSRYLATGDAENPRNVTFVAEVTAEGQVLGFDLSYDAVVGNATVRVTWGLRFEDVGSTTVSRPEWVDRAVTEVCADGSGPEWCRQ